MFLLSGVDKLHLAHWLFAVYCWLACHVAKSSTAMKFSLVILFLFAAVSADRE